MSEFENRFVFVLVFSKCVVCLSFAVLSLVFVAVNSYENMFRLARKHTSSCPRTVYVYRSLQ